VAFINYVKPFKSPQEARYVYEQFSTLGNLSWWHDYTSPAGYKHYGGRSMAVYTLDNGTDAQMIEEERLRLTDDLQSIVGLPKLSDWELLQNGEKEIIRPIFQFLDTKPSKGVHLKIPWPEHIAERKDVEVKAATKYEPFFVASTHGTFGYMSRFVKMKTSDSMPLSVYVDVPESKRFKNDYALNPSRNLNI